MVMLKYLPGKCIRQQWATEEIVADDCSHPLCRGLLKSLLITLQYYCFHFRKSFPSISEQAELKSSTLLGTVDEGVQILADLADILEAGGSSNGSPSVFHPHPCNHYSRAC